MYPFLILLSFLLLLSILLLSLSASSVTIDEDIVIDGPVRYQNERVIITGNISIRDGGSLVFKGCDIRINRSVYIDSGGQLTFEDCNLTLDIWYTNHPHDSRIAGNTSSRLWMRGVRVSSDGWWTFGSGHEYRIVFEGEAARIDSIGPLLQARAEHTAVLVEVKKRDQDGNPVLDVDGDPVLVENVLVCGGLIDAVEATKTCELIDPEKGTVEQRGDVGTPRWRHTATVLPDGLVLIAGGFYGGARPSAYGTAEILDPDREQLNKRRAMMAQRGGHTATLMPNGMVLLAGGMANGSDMAGFDYEIFVP